MRELQHPCHWGGGGGGGGGGALHTPQEQRGMEGGREGGEEGKLAHHEAAREPSGWKQMLYTGLEWPSYTHEHNTASMVIANSGSYHNINLHQIQFQYFLSCRGLEFQHSPSCRGLEFQHSPSCRGLEFQHSHTIYLRAQLLLYTVKLCT